MADLNNSARKLLRATYTPIKPGHDQLSRLKMAWPKYAFISGLRITHDELASLRKKPDAKPPAIHAIESVVNQKGTASALENVPIFVEVEWDSLVLITERLAKLRERELEIIRTTHAAISQAHEQEQSGRERQDSKALPHAATITMRTINDEPRAISPVIGMPLKSTLEWAVKNRIKTKEASELLDLLPQLFDSPDLAKYEDLEAWAVAKVQQVNNHILAMKQHATTEPVGLLHLERLNFVPAGIERGELIHSVPLSPGEEVNIAHKEWSNTSEEFSRIVTDFMEAYSEEGVAEKSELTQSTSSQEQHSSAFNTGVTASGGYGPITISSSLGYNVSDSSSHSEQSARKHSMETTRKASARSKKEHKISFKVASSAGTEDQQVRKIKNPFADKATRLDYYQLVRKWRVDLYRYGLRLTYDVMIPEPGSGLLSRIKDIQDLTAALEVPFGDPSAPAGSAAYFPWHFGQVSDMEMMALAAEYGVTGVDPYPGYGVDSKDFILTAGFVAQEDATHEQQFVQTIPVPEGNVVSTAEITSILCNFWEGDMNENNEGILRLVTPFSQTLYTFNKQEVELPFDLTSSWEGRRGDLPIAVGHWWVSLFNVTVTVKYGAETGILQEWRMKIYAAIREAAQARYEQYRQSLKDKLARLQEAIEGQDPLSLRKVEREEVMKCVLRWLLGPQFDFTTIFKGYAFSDIAISSKDPWIQALAGFAMSSVGAHAEIIKFLHHAIEWENMLYFLYPYFWSYPGSKNERWEFKKYLNHPDLMHQTFLKSGSARAVLTIRPGFETDFVTFLETGKFDPLSQDHPYFSIANEMEAYSKVNYPGIKPANPVEDARPLLTPKQRKAWNEMQQIMHALDKYHSDNGVYPTTQQGLGVLSNVSLNDPWGHPYVYTSPGVYHDVYDLASYGADGVPDADALPDSKEEAADITSWAEANLIGRWYEYTPTSALDIAFNEILPEA